MWFFVNGNHTSTLTNDSAGQMDIYNVHLCWKTHLFVFLLTQHANVYFSFKVENNGKRKWEQNKYSKTIICDKLPDILIVIIQVIWTMKYDGW